MVAASGGYDLPAFANLTTFKTWAEEAPPKGTLFTIRTRITTLVEQGVLKPVIDTRYPLARAQEALDYSESGHAKGKIVIKVK